MVFSHHYLRIFRQLQAHRKVMYFFVFAMAVMALALPLFLFFFNHTLPILFFEQNRDDVGLYASVLIGLVVIRSVASYVYLYSGKKVCAAVCLALRVALLDKLSMRSATSLGLNQYNLSERLIQDVTVAVETVVRVMTILVKDGLTVLGLAVCLLYLSWELGLFVLVIVPLIIMAVVFALDVLQNERAQVMHVVEALVEKANHVIQQFRVIQLYRAQSDIRVQLKQKAEQGHTAELSQISFHALILAAGQLIICLIVMAVAAWAVQMFYRDEVTVSELFTLCVAALLQIMPLSNLFRLRRLLEQGQVAVDRVFSILDSEIEQDKGIYTISNQAGLLALEGVSIYSGSQQKSVLIDVNLAMKPGEMTAVVNATRSERQAIIDLLLGFHRPSKGRVQWDGYNIEAIKQSDLFDHFSIISSDETLLAKTIAANIAYGDMHDASESEIVAAAHTALAMAFIREMPDGLQTRVGKGGEVLTSLQIRQLAIARAVLKNSTHLILDNVPDNMISSTDQLFIAIYALMQGRSTLMFTENQFMLEKADHIIMLDGGYVTATGIHSELLNQNLKYTQIIKV